MTKAIIEKIKNDKVYQFGLILFISVLSLKLLVDYSAKKHGVTGLKVPEVGSAATAAAAAPNTRQNEAGYSITPNRPARGTAAGIALMKQRNAAPTRTVASATAGAKSWSLSQSGREKPRQEIWRQSSGYTTLPKSGDPLVAARAASPGSESHHEMKGSEIDALEREIAGVKPGARSVVKKKIARR